MRWYALTVSKNNSGEGYCCPTVVISRIHLASPSNRPRADSCLPGASTSFPNPSEPKTAACHYNNLALAHVDLIRLVPDTNISSASTNPPSYRS